MLLAGCLGSGDSSLPIVIAGSGHGWVKSLSTGEVCTESCVLPVLWSEGGTRVRVGTSEQLLSSSLPLDELHQVIVPSSDRALEVEFGPDPDAVGIVFPSKELAAIALAPDGDVIYTADDGLHRIAPDGTERWRTATTVRGLLSVSSSGQIITGAWVNAFRADGSLAWQNPIVATAIAALPDGGAVALAGTKLHGLAAADGRERWSVDVPGAMPFIVAGPTGTVAVAAGTQILRVSADGAPLPVVELPVAVTQLAYSPDGLLIARSVAPAPGSSLLHIRTLVITPAGAITSDTARQGVTAEAIAPMDGRIFTWAEDRTDFHGTPFTLGFRLEAWAHDGTATWTLEKPFSGNPVPHETSEVERAVPRMIACNRTHCAAAGIHEGAPPELSRWLEVVSPR